jgi:hypothetical protein
MYQLFYSAVTSVSYWHSFDICLPPICHDEAVAEIYRTLYSEADVTPISTSVAWGGSKHQLVQKAS